jgi:hypothetical protein
MSLNFNAPAEPPTGCYFVTSCDGTLQEWLHEMSFETTRYCPGKNGGCPTGGCSVSMEALRLALRSVQEERGWTDAFVVNPMHVGRD